ncbi:MAG TPA: PDZ domain-containing protein [Gemmatimonadales bacterium]
MPSRWIVLPLFVLHTGTTAAQPPYRHFAEAVDVRAGRSQPVLGYTLRVDSTDLSSVRVELRIRNAPDTLRLAMVTHPEYDDRYWRYVEAAEVTAPNGGSITTLDSTLWRVVAPGGESTVRYRVRLPNEGPRRAGWRPFLAPTGGLIGGPHTLMYVVGATLAPAHVTLELPAGWDVATGLTPTADPRTFFAPSAFVLTDSPMLVGRLRSWRFGVDGVPHRVVYWPLPDATPFDTAAVVDGLTRLARQAETFFGRLPYREYLFQLQDGGLGSLEHMNSVSLGARSVKLAEDPTGFFAEAAHEYFHTWNLMRIRPVEYGDVSYRTPPRSRGLWWSEGLTIYYADLLLRRAGLPVFDSTRVSHLEGVIGRYLSRPGNAHFSAESVSVVAYGGGPGALGDYDASTHLQGEVLGTMLDFIVRDATSGRRTLEDVMRLMLDRFSGERGFTGAGVERAIADVCGCTVRSFFDRHVRAGNPVDFNRYLGLVGLRAQVSRVPSTDREGKPVPDLRVFAADLPGGGARLILTDPGSAWGRAGLHSGDRIRAVNGAPVADATAFRELRNRMRLGDSVRVEVERSRGRRVTATVVLAGFDRPVVRIAEITGASDRARRLRAAWLAGQ